MKNTTELQFFLKEARDDALILQALNPQLGFALETLDHQIPDAVGVLIVGHHKEGFPTSCLATWPSSHVLKKEEQEIISALAKALNVDILLDVDRSELGDEWLLIHPGGSFDKVKIAASDNGIDLVDEK